MPMVIPAPRPLCVDCHTNDFNQTNNPNHQSLNLSNDCATCHSTQPGWSPATFPVHNDYYGPGRGSYRHCKRLCHLPQRRLYKHPQYLCGAATSMTMIIPPILTTRRPVTPTIVAACHAQSAWQPASFDHNNNTGFPLTGAHASTECGQLSCQWLYRHSRPFV